MAECRGGKGTASGWAEDGGGDNDGRGDTPRLKWERSRDEAGSDSRGLEEDEAGQSKELCLTPTLRTTL